MGDYIAFVTIKLEVKATGPVEARAEANRLVRGVFCDHPCFKCLIDPSTLARPKGEGADNAQ